MEVTLVIRRISLASVLCVLGSLLGASRAAAVDDGSCLPFFTQAFSPAFNYLEVIGTRVTARGPGGFASFSMSETYEVESGLASPAAAAQSAFRIHRAGAGTDRYYSGKFHDVFPERGNGDEDLTTFTFTIGGSVRLVLDSWGGGSVPLAGVSCYSGHFGDSFILTGYNRTPGWGVSVFSFLVMPPFSR
jgi:hypothetical protein